MTDDVHKRKLKKNLAVLALVLGWVALIWLITMTRLAHGAEIYMPHGDDATNATTVIAPATTPAPTADAATPADSMNALNGSYVAQRTSHQTQMEATTAQWNKDWQGKSADRAATQTSLDDKNAAHEKTMEGNIAGWNTTYTTTTAPANAQTIQKMDAARAAHLQTTDPNPQSWWRGWLSRHSF